MIERRDDNEAFDEAVLANRYCLLSEAGYAPREALELARQDVDLSEYLGRDPASDSRLTA